MNRKWTGMLLGLVVGLSPIAVHAAGVAVGSPAPDFKLTGSDGTTHSLGDFKGKVIVLEWYNRSCPFIRKHYDSGNMQSLQHQYAAKGVVWLSICSSAKGKEGYMTVSEATADRIKNRLESTQTLLDPDGKVGMLYGAKTTPNMYIIDTKGVLVYKGAIDDKPSTDKEDIATAHNYVSKALDEVLAGKPVTTSDTKPYGCGVKYAE